MNNSAPAFVPSQLAWVRRRLPSGTRSVEVVETSYGWRWLVVRNRFGGWRVVSIAPSGRCENRWVHFHSQSAAKAWVKIKFRSMGEL